MKRIIKLVLVTLIGSALFAFSIGATLSGNTVVNNEPTESNSACYSIVPKNAPTGLSLPSLNEREVVESKADNAIKILPNSFGIQRINNALLKINKTLLPQTYALPGNGIITFKNRSIMNSNNIAQLQYSSVLPKNVDNSKLEYFPPIGDQGSLGTCAVFATSYYAMTYTTAMAKGWNVKAGDYSKIFSPKWMYNFLNGGADNGCWPGDIAYTMESIGALTWDEEPYDNNYLEWPSDITMWEDALKYRNLNYGYINDINTPTGFTNLKNALNNGMVVVMDTDNIFGWMGNAIKDNVNSTFDDSEVGKWAAYYMIDGASKHSLTIVGYNDDIWIDRNNDNIQQPGELGAFRVANSWGSSWGDDGFTWFSYAAIDDTMDTTGHNGIIMGNSALYLDVGSTDYKPLLTAGINLTTANRGDLQYYYGLNWSETTMPNPISRFDWNGGYFKLPNLVGWPFFNYGGDFSFKGTKDAESGIMLIDLSDVAKGGGDSYRYDWTKAGGPLSFCFGILNSKEENTQVTVNQITFKNWETGQSFHVSDLQDQESINNDFKWYHAVSVLNPDIEAPAAIPNIGQIPQMAEGVPTLFSVNAAVNEWRFTPSCSGTYIYRTNSENICIELQNSAGETLYSSDTIPGDITEISATLLKGETYILKAWLNTSCDVAAPVAEIYQIDPVTDDDISDLIIKDSDFFSLGYQPNFSQSISDYSISLAYGKNDIRIYPIPESEQSHIRINDTDSSSIETKIDMGESKTENIVITSFDGSASKEYQITLYYPNYYKVSYQSNGGSNISDAMTAENSLISKPNDPAYLGHSFAGWFTDIACTHSWNFDTYKVTKNITLYAKWLIDSFSVSFNPQGGSAVTCKTANYSTTISAPVAPTRTGYTFISWCKETSCMHAWNFSTDKVLSNITLYAKWTINTYTVTFNSQGGTAVAKKTAPNNTVIAAPAAPFRAGFVFMGWYREPACTHAWDFSTDKVTANITLYARWVSSTPVAKAASASYTSISVTWAAVPSAKGYEVWQATVKNGKYAPMGTTQGTSFLKTGLATGKTYYYKVRSYTLSGSTKVYSNYSSIASAWPKPAKPAALTAARASSTSIRLTWGKVVGATKYEIWRCVAGGNFALFTTKTSNSCTDTKLTTGTTYYYEVRAYCMLNGVKVYGEFSAIASAKP